MSGADCAKILANEGENWKNLKERNLEEEFMVELFVDGMGGERIGKTRRSATTAETMGSERIESTRSVFYDVYQSGDRRDLNIENEGRNVIVALRRVAAFHVFHII
jgi:hypothetical protein